MLVVLTGIMFGSLNKVWPWKITVTTYLNSHGETKPLLEQSISPFSFDGDPQLMLSILLALAGFFIIITMERVAKLKK
jgi:putative membrane protein